MVIGGGCAGLAVADELLRGEDGGRYKVTILEETEEIGGISKTVKVGKNRMDMGGHRFFSKDARVMDYWRGLMPVQGKAAIDDKILGREKELAKGGPDPEKTDRVMLVRQRVSRIYYDKKFFDYPVSLSLRTLRNLGFKDVISVGASYLRSAVRKRPEKSLEDFYVNRFGRKLYEMFFEKYTEKLWGRKPSEMAADWGGQRVKGVSVSAVLKDAFSKPFRRFSRADDSRDFAAKKETSLIEQFCYPKFGPGQLYELAAERIRENGGEILLGAKVVGLKRERKRISEVIFIDASGKKRKMRADVVVSSMALSELVESLSEKPKKAERIASGLMFRDFQTVGVLVKKMKLKNETKIKTLGGIVPDCWIYVQDPEVKMLRMQIFNNWSPYMVEKPGENVWIGLEYTCEEGDEMWEMRDGEFSEFATDELVKMGIVEREAIISAHREKVRKAYPVYAGTYGEIDYLRKFLNRIENLYCVGRNGQHRYNNMDHSILTGMLAAEAIRKNGEGKEGIWEVNTEESYHEEAA